MEVVNAELGSEFQKFDSSTYAVEAGDAHLSPVWSWKGRPPHRLEQSPAAPVVGVAP